MTTKVFCRKLVPVGSSLTLGLRFYLFTLRSIRYTVTSKYDLSKTLVKPFNPDEIKTFKTPKYGGITLSLLSMFVLASMIVVWNKIGEQEENRINKSIKIVCDEAVAIPVKQCAEQFEREMKIKVSVHSKSVWDQNESRAKKEAYDLDLFAGKLTSEGLALNQIPCAFRSIIFATRKDFEPNITELVQVFQNNLTYSTAPISTKDGRLLKNSLEEAGNWVKVLKQRKKTYPSSGAAALALASGNNVDGAFMWDFSARKFDLKIHRVKELRHTTEYLFAETNRSEDNRLTPMQFARFLAAPTKGQFYFAESGFTGVKGDAWAEKPSLYVYIANPIKSFILDEFDRFEKSCLVSIEPHFLDQKNIGLSLNLIAQSKAKKALPDLVISLPARLGAEMPDQYQLLSGNPAIKNTQLSLYLLKSTRFPVSSKRFHDFLCLNQEIKE